MVRRCCRRPPVACRRRGEALSQACAASGAGPPLPRRIPCIPSTGVGVNLFKTRTRRATALMAGTFLGLAGVVALAAPASAHEPSLIGDTNCLTDGNWQATWHLGNQYQTDAHVKTIELGGKNVNSIGD